MIVIALFTILFCHPGSGTIHQDVTPEEVINEALNNINKYNFNNKYQNLQFKDYKMDAMLYDFASSNVQLGDLSTIQLKPGTQPSMRTMFSNTGTTHYYNATLELKKGFAQYDYLLKFLLIFWSSGTVTATANHSFQVKGTVKIDSFKHCQADVSKISVKIGNFHSSVKPSGLLHFILTPFIRYFTNSHSQNLLPLEAKIADYIQNNIPKSKFSELVCNAFNK